MVISSILPATSPQKIPTNPPHATAISVPKKVTNRVKSKKSEVGILVCGTGTGMAISANKTKKIRAAVCYNLKSTRLSRQHNNANIIAIGSLIRLIVGTCELEAS